MSSEIRLLIIDDHSLFREGLARLLAAEPGFRSSAPARISLMHGSCSIVNRSI